MKKVFFVALLLGIVTAGFSQKAHRPNPYKIAFGAGYYPSLKDPYTVSLKFYTRAGFSVDFIGYNLQESWRLTTLFNPYTPISKDGRFRLIVGPGVHLGWWKDRYKNNSYESNPIVGIDGILGLEYRIPKLPIALQVHYQPSYDLAGNNASNYEKEWCGAFVRIAF